jgi:Type III restriction enzyme, res subunit
MNIAASGSERLSQNNMSIALDSFGLSAVDKRELRTRLRVSEDTARGAPASSRVRGRPPKKDGKRGGGGRLEDGLCLVDDGTTTRLPLAFALQSFTSAALPAPAPVVRTPQLSFVGETRDEQTLVVAEALDDLTRYRSTIISSYPGFGKTCVAIIIATRLNVPTVIVTNKRLLIDQWKAAIDKYVGVGHAQIVTSRTRALDERCQFHIVSAAIIARLSPAILHSERLRQLLIVDELHLIMTPVFSYNLLHISPTYALGLSATPYRLDGYDAAIRWFFGERARGVPLWRRHKVYCFSTNFRPTIKRQWNGDLDWNAVIESQSEDVDRNRLIVDRVCSLVPQRTWQVLTKRVAHVATLRDAFLERGVRCETLFGNQRSFDATACNVLVGTTPKIGVGFDWPVANALCMAADVASYFVQFLGRCMRCKEANGVVPIVIDFIDDFDPLRNHFEQRRAVYLRHGGEITFLTPKRLEDAAPSSRVPLLLASGVDGATAPPGALRRATGARTCDDADAGDDA